MLCFTYSKPDLDCKGAEQTGRGSCDVQKVLCEATALVETRLCVFSLPSVSCLATRLIPCSHLGL